jgi:hypothetical protein
MTTLELLESSRRQLNLAVCPYFEKDLGFTRQNRRTCKVIGQTGEISAVHLGIPITIEI